MLGFAFLRVVAPAASGESAGTQPSPSAIAAARHAMLETIDQRIASLQDLLAQMPADQQPQSRINQRLKDAVAERAQVASASDAEIAAQIAARQAAKSDKLKPPATVPAAINVPVGKLDSPATKPVVSLLETQVLFPGSLTQGQPDDVVRPAAGCDLITLHAPDGTKIVALFGKSATLRAAARPALLYFYGNGASMEFSRDVFNRFRSLGFNVIMADYEGYGMSGGTPSEPGCYAAADAAYDYLLTRNDVDHTRIVATGWSLGAAVAIDLARRRPVAGLVTFSAFTNIDDMSQSLANGLPLGILLSSRFDNLAKIGSVACPILMFHGSRDPLVPPAMLDRLAAAARSKVTKFRVEGAEHNDIFQRGGDSLYERVKSFVDGLSGVTPTTRL
jgi:uncharacterized protein